MNHKRSRNSNEFSSSCNSEVASANNGDRTSNVNQISLLHQPLWFWRRYSDWSCFNRGLFWGGLVALISVCSAMAGVALTTIDVVEQQISQQLNGNLKEASKQQKLTTPLQILLVEVEPRADALVGFSKNSQGKSKNVLLLKLEPERNFARIINIPRDARMQIPGFGMGTVTDAYRIGGIDLLFESLERSNAHITIDRYLRTSSAVFTRLSASGKINLPRCERLNNCSSPQQLMRQQTAFKTIRQRLNIPSYLANFEKAIAEAEPQLDTNISMPELISVVDFIKELEPDRLSVSLPNEYTSARVKNGETQKLPPNSSEIDLGKIPKKAPSLMDKPVAVQNTTDDPDLGRRVVAYLRKRNFRDVYLVRHIPLELEQTKIVTDYGQVETANYLKNILGCGSLEARSSQQQQLILQLGEDALYLPL